jgi:hypothetical protein
MGKYLNETSLLVGIAESWLVYLFQRQIILLLYDNLLKTMPTVLRIGSLIFFFTSYDCSEPIHIHCVDGNKECKYWLSSGTNILLAYKCGFSKMELGKIERIIKENITLLKNAWYEHCKDTKQKEYKRISGNK